MTGNFIKLILYAVILQALSNAWYNVILSSGNFESAIMYAQKWLALDRLNESAHRLLMQLYAWNGQQSAALHQYRECVQVLDRELGVGPLESTTRLYHAIKEHQISPSPLLKQ